MEVHVFTISGNFSVVMSDFFIRVVHLAIWDPNDSNVVPLEVFCTSSLSLLILFLSSSYSAGEGLPVDFSFCQPVFSILSFVIQFCHFCLCFSYFYSHILFCFIGGPLHSFHSEALFKEIILVLIASSGLQSLSTTLGGIMRCFTMAPFVACLS